MNSRPYFYKDSKGVLKKYYYCTFCGTGPFTFEQENHTFFIRGFGSQPTTTCWDCDTVKFPQMTRPPKAEAPKISPAILEQGVSIGQVWRDKDKRRDRTITVSRVGSSKAYYMGGIGGKVEKAITIQRLKSRFTNIVPYPVI